MAQARTSAAGQKPLTVNKTAKLRKRIVPGQVPVDPPVRVERPAAVTRAEPRIEPQASAVPPLEGPEMPSVPSRSWGVAQAGSKTARQGIAGASAWLRAIRAGLWARDPDMRRNRMLAAAAAILLVVSAGLGVTVLGGTQAGTESLTGEDRQPQQASGTKDEASAEAQTVAMAQAPVAPPPEPAIVLKDPAIRHFAQVMLDALRSPVAPMPVPQGPGAAARMAEANPLYRMVAEATAEGQSEAYIDRMLELAHQRGQISVPSRLILEDGRLDTRTLIELFRGG
jgi:hypothetical protein